MKRMAIARRRARALERRSIQRAILRAVLAIPSYVKEIDADFQREILGLLRARRRL